MLNQETQMPICLRLILKPLPSHLDYRYLEKVLMGERFQCKIKLSKWEIEEVQVIGKAVQ